MEQQTKDLIFRDLSYIDHATVEIRKAIDLNHLHDARAHARESKQILEDIYGTLNILIRGDP